MDIDWARYIGEQLGEQKNIDFKAPCAWAGADRAKLAADIIAMSNSEGGGVLVIGVREDSAKKLLLDGCSPEQLATLRSHTGCRLPIPGTFSRSRSWDYREAHGERTDGRGPSR